MSFMRYFWEGTTFDNGKYYRHNYPKDIIETFKTSTYSYKGSITSSNDDGSSKTIDGVVQLTTLSADQRKKALEAWNSLYNKSMASTVIGFTSTTLTIIGTVSGVLTAPVGLCIGIPSGVLTVWSIGRLDQASEAFTQWQDPIIKIQNLRVLCANDFLSLKTQDLRGKVFTTNEVRNIYLQQLMRTRQDYSVVLSSGNPSFLIHYTKEFFERKNLLSLHLFDYAFNTSHAFNASDAFNAPEANDPSAMQYEPGIIIDPCTGTHFRSKEVVEIIHEAENLAQKYMFIEQGRRDERDKVEDFNAGGHLLIHGGHIIYNDNLHRKGRHEDARNTSLLAIAGHAAMEGYSEIQRHDIERRAQNKFLQEFSTPLAAIFRKLDDAKV